MVATLTPEQSLIQLADRLALLRKEKDEVSERLRAINKAIDQINDMLAEQMINEEMPSFQRAGQTFYLSTRTFASARKGRAEELRAWLKANGYGDLVRETIPHQSLSAWCREVIEEEGALPDDLSNLVNVYEKTQVNIRRA